MTTISSLTIESELHYLVYFWLGVMFLSAGFNKLF